MSRALFGTDGIRGVAGEYPLNEEGATQVGRAIGMYFAQPGELIVIGCDPRESSAMLVQAIGNGLTSVGVNVENVGVVPTPGLAYLTRENGDAKAGVMITASHNPYTDNGIKIFSAQGGKLPDNVEIQLNTLIESDIADRGSAGVVRDDRAQVKAYEDFLVNSVGDITLYGYRLVVDTANGATSHIASRAFKRLSTEIMSIFDQPDGKNINDHCGATDTARLQQLVIQMKADAGIAFDGDGDRVMLIDEKGRKLNGDHILYILAVSNGYDHIVGTIMSNKALETALQQKNISFTRTSVGDRYVLDALLEQNLKLGGEQSGHIILPDLLQTGDGMLAAMQVFKHVQLSGKKLADWYDEIQMLPQALVNIHVADKQLLDHPEIASFTEAQDAEIGDAGRLVIRPSGTEPKARVMVEAPDAHGKAQEIAGQLQSLLDKHSEANTVPTETPDVPTSESSENSTPLELIEVPENMKPTVTHLALGMNLALKGQLIIKSQQHHIKESTPGDGDRRFHDAASLQTWIEKGREIHWLLGPNQDLAGIVWYGAEEFPLEMYLPEKPEETFAIRLYEGYVGKGLAKSFMQLSLKTHVAEKQKRNEPIKGIWLQTDTVNGAALSAYEKFGYHEVARDEKRVTMILSSEEIQKIADDTGLDKVGESVDNQVPEQDHQADTN